LGGNDTFLGKWYFFGGNLLTVVSHLGTNFIFRLWCQQSSSLDPSQLNVVLNSSTILFHRCVAWLRYSPTLTSCPTRPHQTHQHPLLTTYKPLHTRPFHVLTWSWDFPWWFWDHAWWQWPCKHIRWSRDLADSSLGTTLDGSLPLNYLWPTFDLPLTHIWHTVLEPGSVVLGLPSVVLGPFSVFLGLRSVVLGPRLVLVAL